MKKVRISLALIALVMATGAAFASKSNTSAADCVLTPSGEDPKTYVAPGQTQPECFGADVNPCCVLDGIQYERP